MKKIVLCLMLCFSIVLTLTGCISNAPESTTSAEVSAEEDASAEETADGVSSASEKESSDPAAVVNGLSKDGFWIFSILSDVTVDEPIFVEGDFYDKGEESGELYRKLALYEQDEDRNVTAEYTLTVPYMEVTSPNFRIQNGTVKGDVYVNAEGFDPNGCTIEGNLYFATQEQMDSATLDTVNVTGTTELGEYSE